MCPILGKQEDWRKGYNIMDAEVLIQGVVHCIGKDRKGKEKDEVLFALNGLIGLSVFFVR